MDLSPSSITTTSTEVDCALPKLTTAATDGTTDAADSRRATIQDTGTHPVRTERDGDLVHVEREPLIDVEHHGTSAVRARPSTWMLIRS